MFHKDIIRRLENAEQHILQCDERAAKFLVMEAELSAQLKEMSTFFTEFTKREEGYIKEHAKQEKEVAKENTRILENIKEDIQSIKTDLASHPKDVALQLLQQKEENKIYCNSTFSTKEELTDGLSSIRRQAKLVWMVILASLAGTAWVIDKLIQLLSLIGK